MANFYNTPITSLLTGAQTAEPYPDNPNQWQETRAKKRKGNELLSPKTPASSVKPIIVSMAPRPAQIFVARAIRATFPHVRVLQCRELRNPNEMFIQPADESSRTILSNQSNLNLMFPNVQISTRSPIQKQKETPSYVITNVSFNYTLDDIKLELSYCNLPPKDLSRIVSRVTNKETKLIRVFAAHPSHVVRAVENGVTLGFQLHRCEASNRKPNVTQCFKCQGYGHISKDCVKTLTCLRCSGDHAVKDCVKPKEDPLCANCGEKHAAIYKGCKSYQAEVSKVVEKQQQRKTYANAASSSITNSIQVENVIVFIADLLQKLRAVLHTMSGSDVIAAVSQCATLHFKLPVTGEVIYNLIEQINKPTNQEVTADSS